VFTGLKLFNQPVSIHGKSDLLKKDISLTHSITFSSRQNIFTIEFAALNYVKSGKNKYAYELDGFEKDWNYVDNPSATYTNLPPGHYTFLVRGTNNDGLWNANPARMQIIVLPPLWKTWWAYLAYIIIIGVILYLVIRFFRRQARLERDLYYEQQQIDFFTNISHEIRTPLTLIVGPIDKLLQHTAGDSFVSRQLGLAKKNADRLVRLVTELLDFRKAESGNMQLWVSRNNMVLFAKEIFSSFEELAVNQSITYHFEATEESIMASFDPAQMEKVLYNLLSNAFKFTDDKGAITLSVQRTEEIGNNGEGWVQMRVTNTGKGIPPEAQSRLFERFYQATASNVKTPGSGIGLALSKSIVELHQGKIRVESRLETEALTGNTSFTILLPRGTETSDRPALTKSLPAMDKQEVKEELTGEPTQKPTILLVEDNPEIRQLIRDSLSGLYHIEESSNGAEGWEAAIRIIPDLVISDVMMEGADDGFVLCQRIKQDEKTSHIPVILLTARVAAVHQISGLRTGADAYITKPFHIEVLELQVRNLLSLRNIIRSKFTRQVTLQPPQAAVYSSEELPAIPSAGELFLEKLVAIVEEQMEDPEFGVPVLLKKVGMSQTVLYRKLKALTDMSIADFIKSVRLKRAAQLLVAPAAGMAPERTGMPDDRPPSVADVAYMVGFSDRKYFSKEFRKQFGQSPTEYQSAATPNPETPEKG
jgi:signal transduction histidine kinase/CheY-like chemotaxis protein